MNQLLRSSRGNVLIVTVLSLAVLLMMAVGIVQLTGKNLESATSKLAGDRMEACAETARQYLLSRLRLFGVEVTNLQLDERLPDAVSDADKTQLLTDHYHDGAAAKPTIAAVSAASVSSSRKQVRDLANSAPGSLVLGGQYYRVVVKCRVSDQRESELEFMFRYGL